MRVNEMIPDDWSYKQLKEIALVTSGGTPSRTVPNYWGGNIPWVRTTEVQNCIVAMEDLKEFITQKGLDNSSAKMLPAGSILMAMIGQGKTRGQVALLSINAACNQNSAAIILHDGNSPEFFFNYLKSQYQNIRNYSNSAGQSNLSGALVKSIRVPVPPLPEQKKISLILSTWDKAIETVEKLIENSQQKKKAIMQQLLTGKNRFPRLDGAWVEIRLGDVFIERVETGIHDLPLLSITRDQGIIYRHEVGRKDTSNNDKSKYRRICSGDIGYNTMRMWQGVSSLSQLEGIISPAYTVITPTDKIDALFASYLFKLPRTIHDFLRFSQGLTSDTWNLKFKQFREVKVNIPLLHEQKSIAKALSVADLSIENLCADLGILKQQKKALMQQLLTGKIRVKVN